MTSIDKVLSECPEYFRQNIGPGQMGGDYTTRDYLNRANKQWDISLGYTIKNVEKRFPFFIRERNFGLWAITCDYSNEHIIRHEAMHSFELNIIAKSRAEWRRFQDDIGEIDSEELAEMFARGEKSEAIEKFINGGYQ